MAPLHKKAADILIAIELVHKLLARGYSLFQMREKYPTLLTES